MGNKKSPEGLECIIFFLVFLVFLRIYGSCIDFDPKLFGGIFIIVACYILFSI